MHPDIEKLITLALSDGTVTEKEREIILRKAEKLNLDIDEVEMYLEGKIANHSGINPKDSSANQVSKSSKREFVPKVVQRVQPAKLDREATLAENIKNLELLQQNVKSEIKKLEEERITIKIDHDLLKYEDELNVEMKNLEVEKTDLLNDYSESFIKEINPKLKSGLSIELNINNSNIKKIIFNHEYEKLKSDETFWINYRRNHNLKVIVTGYLICWLIILFIDIGNKLLNIIVLVILGVYIFTVKPKSLFKDDELKTAFEMKFGLDHFKTLINVTVQKLYFKREKIKLIDEQIKTIKDKLNDISIISK